MKPIDSMVLLLAGKNERKEKDYEEGGERVRIIQVARYLLLILSLRKFQFAVRQCLANEETSFTFFDQLVSLHVPDLLVALLTHDDATQMQFEAAWCLTNLTAGTHAHTKAVVAANALPGLAHVLMHSPHPGIGVQAAWALGNIAVDDTMFHDEILVTGGVHGLLHVLESTSDVRKLGLRRERARQIHRQR